MITLFILFTFLGFPMLMCWAICDDRNRNTLKGCFLGFFFGWFAVIGLWLMLKTRDKNDPRVLY